MNTASCGGKTSYPSFQKAEKAAKGLRRKVSAHARAFPCRTCGSYHLGNSIGPGHLDATLRRQKLERIERRELAWA